MNLTIQIDDESKFKEVVEKELNAFTRDELHEILIEAIRQYLKDSDVIKRLFVDVEYSRYDNRPTYRPTSLLREICSKIDLTEDCKEVADSVKKEITENSRDIVSELFAKAISSQVFKVFESEGWLDSAIFRAIASTKG